MLDKVVNHPGQPTAALPRQIPVSFAKNHRRRFEPGRPRFVLPPFAASPMMRLLFFALAGLVAAVYGVVRHYTTSPAPMLVPVPPSTVPTYDADAGEWPVPERWLDDAGGT
jgi:hypothetical protein